MGGVTDRFSSRKKIGKAGLFSMRERAFPAADERY